MEQHVAIVAVCRLTILKRMPAAPLILFVAHRLLAYEANVSVLFRSKGRAKNGAGKRGGGGEERKEVSNAIVI